MARVHRQMSADGVPFSADQPVSSLTTQLQVSTAQVAFKSLLYCFAGEPRILECADGQIYI
jgi:hypothetical protein